MRLIRARATLQGGVPFVVVTEKGPKPDALETFEAEVKFKLKLERCRVQQTGDCWLVFGSTASPISASERKKLRSQGHALEPSVLIGRAGLTANLIDAVGTALERHGLVKVKLTPQSSMNKDEAAVAMAWATGSHLIQRIGKTALLYRADVPLDPPTKRVRRH